MKLDIFIQKKTGAVPVCGGAGFLVPFFDQKAVFSQDFASFFANFSRLFHRAVLQ